MEQLTMEQLMWKVIEDTKAGKEFLNSEEQYKNLEKVLSQYDKETIKGINDVWRKRRYSFSNNREFDKLHWSKGGIVRAGDDGFYMDFGNWLVAQGKTLNDQFDEKGHSAVLNFIKKHNIDERDYQFESMSYAFHPYVFD